MEQSFFSLLFQDLQEHIKQKVPAVHWIDLDYGQADFDRPRVTYPAVLIDFLSSSFTEMGQGAQAGEVTVSIKLITDNFAHSDAAAPEEVRKQALTYLALEHTLTEQLHGYEPERGYCTPLIRISAESQNRGEIGLRVRVIRFTTSFETYPE